MRRHETPLSRRIGVTDPPNHADRVNAPENRRYRIESTRIFSDAILWRIPVLALRYTRSFKLTARGFPGELPNSMA